MCRTYQLGAEELIFMEKRGHYCYSERMKATVEFVAGGGKWIVASGACDEVKAWLEKYFPSIFNDKASFMKDHPRTKVACRAGLVIKHNIPKLGLLAKLKRTARPKASHAFLLGKTLSDAGVAVAEALAWGATADGHTYLITREVADARTLDEWIVDSKVEVSDKMRILSGVGGLLGSIHNAGFSNRDMKNTNILCARGTGGEFDVYAIDLDGVRRRLWLTKRVFLRDMWCILHALAAFNWDNMATRKVVLGEYCRVTGRKIALDELVPFSAPAKPIRPDWKCSVIRTGWSGFSKRRLIVHSAEPHDAWAQALHTEWLYRSFEKGAHTRPIPDDPIEVNIEVLDGPAPVLVRLPPPVSKLTKKIGPSQAAELLKYLQNSSDNEYSELVPVALVEEIVKGKFGRSALLVGSGGGQVPSAILNGLTSLRNEIMAKTKKM